MDGLVKPLLQNVNFPVVSANIIAKNQLASNITRYFFPSTTLEVGSEKVGIVGYTTKETPVLSNPGMLSLCSEFKCYSSSQVLFLFYYKDGDISATITSVLAPHLYVLDIVQKMNVI